MEITDKVYAELRKHLDKQAVGFPATESGVEIRLLRHLFTPEQAGLALFLNYQPQSAMDIYNSAKDSGITPEKVESMLEEMESNGSIGSTEKKGTAHYFTIPLLVGIVELHAHKATPQFWADFNTYASGEFGRAYAGTKVSQMRTVPVEKSITVEQHVTTYDQIRDIINSTEGPIIVTRCMCREGAKQRGQPCKKTQREETCMGFGDWARRSVKSGNAKEITKEEALEIVEKSEEAGLVHFVDNVIRDVKHNCNCCGCACWNVGNIKRRKIPRDVLMAIYFIRETDMDKCVGCGECAKICPVDAVVIEEKQAIVDKEWCIGCGLCVRKCHSGAANLRLKTDRLDHSPSPDFVTLHEQILKEKGFI